MGAHKRTIGFLVTGKHGLNDRVIASLHSAL
jgi:RNA-binding protein YhbY